MPGVRVELTEETTTLDLTGRIGGLEDSVGQREVGQKRRRVPLWCANVRQCVRYVCLCVGWRERFSEAVVRAWITVTRC